MNLLWMRLFLYHLLLINNQEGKKSIFVDVRDFGINLEKNARFRNVCQVIYTTKAQIAKGL